MTVNPKSGQVFQIGTGTGDATSGDNTGTGSTYGAGIGATIGTGLTAYSGGALYPSIPILGAVGGALGFGVEWLYNNIFDNFNNVRDIYRPQGDLGVFEKEGAQDNSRGFGSGMQNFMWWDSEIQQLEENLMDIDRVNALLGTNYVMDANYKQLVKNALDTYAWRVNEGGDQMEKRMIEYNGDIFEAEAFSPSLTNADATRAIETAEENMLVGNWNIVGMPQGSGAYKALFEENDINESNINFKSVTTPSIVNDIPMYMNFTVNGHSVLAESKKMMGDGTTLEEQIALSLGKGDVVVMDRTRRDINRLQDSFGYNQFVTGEHVYGIMLQNWLKLPNIDQATADKLTRDYLWTAFANGNPEAYSRAQQWIQQQVSNSQMNISEDQLRWQILTETPLGTGASFINSPIRK